MIDETPFIQLDIDKLKYNCSDKFSSDSHKYETCVICFNEFTNGEEILQLPVCGHIYHTNCLIPWLERKNKCAICKGGVRYNLFMMIYQGLGKVSQETTLSRITDEETLERLRAESDLSEVGSEEDRLRSGTGVSEILDLEETYVS